MKAQIISTSKSGLMLLLMFILSFFVATKAQAHFRHGPYAPVAICSTSGTSVPLPYYVCCSKYDKYGPSFRNQWVPVSCKYADVRAVPSRGCMTSSPLFFTGQPIAADCQFSFSTGKYLYNYL
ncbi:MAG TPA: hypothetical protein VHM20_02905 [Gammaproteobacteria bacterium]|jgi:hypothetical protein|nr:hypothetical protein [Gammaproteobacteria bacterium]